MQLQARTAYEQIVYHGESQERGQLLSSAVLYCTRQSTCHELSEVLLFATASKRHLKRNVLFGCLASISMRLAEPHSLAQHSFASHY